MTKWIVRIGLALVLVVIVVLVGFYFYIDVAARRAIERGGSYATGTPTTVQGVNLGLWRGELRMDDFQVANPPGYDTDYFLQIGRGEVDVTLRSLLTREVQVPRVHLERVRMHMEMVGADANYRVILRNLERLSGPPDQQPEDMRDARRYVIRELVLTDVHVQATLRVPGIEPRIVPVTLAEIRLTDVGSETDGGVLMSQVQGIVIQAVLEAVIAQGEGLPGPMLATLRSGMEGVQNIGGEAIDAAVDVLRRSTDQRLQEGERTLQDLLGRTTNDEQDD